MRLSFTRQGPGDTTMTVILENPSIISWWSVTGDYDDALPCFSILTRYIQRQTGAVLKTRRDRKLGGSQKKFRKSIK